MENQNAKIEVLADRPETGALTVLLSGRLDSAGTARIWPEMVRRILSQHRSRLIVEASGVTYCDGAGLALLVKLACAREIHGGRFEIEGLSPAYRRMFDEYDHACLATEMEQKSVGDSIPVAVGRRTVGIGQGIYESIAFVGRLTTTLARAAPRPGTIRWKDSFRIAEQAGVNALPLVLLISFLVGLIMAFQAAVPMRRFGAEIFVADLIALSVIRELGPLMTAIILAGRSGSAFAAEIGTMKVNEEIDALVSMGLDPVSFLATPRVMAAVLMTPLLTVFADLVGVIGGAIPLLTLGYSATAYIEQAVGAVNWVDLWGGLVKSVVFGILIAGVGCLRGLQTETGPSAVGDATTRSVVSSIILITIFDGLFAVVYYYLGV